MESLYIVHNNAMLCSLLFTLKHGFCLVAIFPLFLTFPKHAFLELQVGGSPVLYRIQERLLNLKTWSGTDVKVDLIFTCLHCLSSSSFFKSAFCKGGAGLTRLVVSLSGTEPGTLWQRKASVKSGPSPSALCAS